MTVAADQPQGQEGIAWAARVWAEKGFSVVPILANGTKRPAFEWKNQQHQLATPAEVLKWFRNHPDQGIAVICGQVSGNLEMTELEGRATSEDSIATIYDAFELHGEDALDFFDGLWTSGYVEITPSGGIHFLYRVADHEVPPNTPIARRPPTAEELAANPKVRFKVLAETRGEGGYVIVAPTGGAVHPSGNSWEIQVGRVGEVPTITWEQRNLLHKVLHGVLDEMPETVEPPKSALPPRQPRPVTGVRAGDAFNDQAEWTDDLLLGGAGWTIDRVQAGTTYWVKPGSDQREGHHATTGRAGSGDKDRLYVFSTATEFEVEQPISKFHAYAVLHHSGDQKAAARELSRRGFGDQTPQFVKPDYDAWNERKVGIDVESNVDSPARQAPPMVTLPSRPRGVEDYTLSGASVRFVDRWGCCVRYVTEQKMWRFWDGARWAEDPDGNRVSGAFELMTEEMRAEAQKMTDEDHPMAKAFTTHVKKLRDSGRTNVMKIIASKVSCSAAEFDSQTRYLNLRNGVYDVVDQVYLPHDPKYMLTKTMGCAYNPSAQAPKAEKFLADVMPDFEQRDYVMRALGYTMTGEADQRAFFLLHGLPGTGKSQFIEMIKDIFGDYGVTAMASTFHKRNNAEAATPGLHALRGARFITTSETSQDSQLDDELLKRFTGKDVLTTRSLYETPQSWLPQGAIWFATNHLPKLASDEEAIWKRVKTLTFVTQFSDDGSSGQVSEPNIGRKIAAEEADGIFNLLIGALAAYRAKGHLHEPPGIKAAIANHRHDVDPVAQFVDDSILSGELAEEPGAQTELGPLYQAYCNYHKQELGSYPLGRRRFADSLRSILGYDRLLKSGGKTYVPGWKKKGWVIGGRDIGGD